jgi:urea transport system ATP-binding protein
MLNVENLRAAYGQSEVLHGLDLNVGKGEIVAVMGRNGMGKTTLMKTLMGVMPELDGTTRIGSTVIHGQKPHQRVMSGLAYVPQGSMIFSSMTVEENIQTGLTTTGSKTVPQDIYDLFPVLLEMKSRRGGNLSGGQQQQLAIARALASNPKVLLLDEPTEGIQPSIIREMARTLRQIRDEKDLTIIVSEQVLSFALDVADRVIVIENGRFVHDSPRSEVNEAHVSKFLSV